MISVSLDRLNPLETRIHETILKESQVRDDLTITNAAEICGCSISKISKFIKKLGFQNYKQYMSFVYGNDVSPKSISNELDRIRHFIDEFDATLVDQFIELMEGYQKIILFGYGPSYVCVEYFEYKLRFATNKITIAVQEELTVGQLIDDKSLLVIFSTTGHFKSFDSLYRLAKENKCETLLIIEEYNLSLLEHFDKIFFLTKSFQSEALAPHEKSRTVFFIFIEEVIQKLLNKEYRR